MPLFQPAEFLLKTAERPANFTARVKR